MAVLLLLLMKIKAEYLFQTIFPLCMLEAVHLAGQLTACCSWVHFRRARPCSPEYCFVLYSFATSGKHMWIIDDGGTTMLQIQERCSNHRIAEVGSFTERIAVHPASIGEGTLGLGMSVA